MTELDPGLVWLATGIVLLVAEVAAPGAFLMWLGIAALGTGALELVVPLGFGQQVALFAVLAAASIALGLRLRGARRRPVLNTPNSGLVGRTAHAIAFEGADGRVRVGDSDWPARLVTGNSAPPADAALRVVGVDGTVLVVAPREDMTKA